MVGSVAALALLAVLLNPGLPASGRPHGVTLASVPAAPSLGNPTPLYTNISYASSVDGFSLAYGEILPVNYTPSKAYPLLVYFHGEGTVSSIVGGGSGDGLKEWNNSSYPTSKILSATVWNASTFHFIIIAPSPRSSEGFYTNSPCGGPEEQDTTDAILHEEKLRNVSKVFALGFSMGSLGGLSFVGHHASMFSGIAVTGTMTDAFEELADHLRPLSGLLTLTCGARPGATNLSVDRLFAYLSVLRFHPSNLSGIRLWASAGSDDVGAPDNPAFWPYLQVNDTLLNRTCLVASSLGEPANCTVPWRSLHLRSPGSYLYRFVYEIGGGHTLGQLEPADMFQFFLGRVGGGCFTSTFPPTVNTACP